MSWASWTTRNVYTGRGGALTEETGVMTGNLTVHTTWADGTAQVALQFTGATDWFTMTGSPTPCPSEEASRALHDAVVQAVRNGAGAVVPSWAPQEGAGP
ncbi:hypothetical protein [Streptomyces peucetius]|uniref:DUF317 domain-containing protein n=1 Tax=Streptomyces peucetius TaxID=1950 RepID=A0ABY6IIQ6_STRPE|nr:hypothetical protein [Streptomyces peucetius]UYQ66045.1 hypothetical protein OGH68_34370 [Streptomyces peucetius]